MIVRVCNVSGYDYTKDNCYADSKVSKLLESHIQVTLDDMQEKGYVLKHIEYSSSCCLDSNNDMFHAKSAILIFDDGN